MAITITSGAESTALTTVDVLRDDLSVDDTASNNANLYRHILMASDTIVRYCGRDFAKQTIAETLPSTGGKYLRLSRIPVVTLTSVTYDGTLVAASEYVLTEPQAGYIYNEDGWNATYGAYDYSVAYTYGYVLPSFSTGTRNLPYDIEQACLMLAKTTYMGRSRDTGIISEEVSDVYSVRFGGAVKRSSLMSPEIREMLEPYRLYKL